MISVNEAAVVIQKRYKLSEKESIDAAFSLAQIINKLPERYHNMFYTESSFLQAIVDLEVDEEVPNGI